MNQAEHNRRTWLGTTAGGMALAWSGNARAAETKRPRVAMILTEFTYRSHAHVIVENFLVPYYFNGKLTDPGVDVAAFYVDQLHKDRDMARDVAKEFGIPIFPTIAGALRLGGSELAVDGVVSIGEHGDYPKTEHGIVMYPRKRFFDEIVAVFRQDKRVVPLFNDKHLSYRWDQADEMARTVDELKIPFMAGSSVPLAERRPTLELPDQAEMEEAVSIHSGPPESYDFHALEVLQSMVEARRGGESGVSEIQWLEGDEVWQAAKEGRWSYGLATAAMQAQAGKDVGKLEDFIEPGDGKHHPPHGFLIKYRDGFRATVLRLGSAASRWCFACRIKGKPEPLSTSFYVGPWLNRNLFKALSHAIQTFIREKQSPYPAERTTLVTGMLASAMDSRFAAHKPIDTPHLDIPYQPRDFRKMREMGETWKIITDETPQPKGISIVGPQN
jgi:hypothetical protein